jgi:hypothetical protein
VALKYEMHRPRVYSAGELLPRERLDWLELLLLTDTLHPYLNAIGK